MAKGRRNSLGSARVLPTRIPIHTLSGGVGRQGPTKRLPSEAENIDNAFVTLERSFEKRSGFEFVPTVSGTFDFGPSSGTTQDLYYHWFSLSDAKRYLIIINFKATDPSSRLLWVYLKDSNGLTDVSPENTDVTVPPKVREYLTYNPGNKKASQTLRIVNVGQTLLFLNRQVKAGFTSDADGFLYGLDGVKTTEVDAKGAEVIYYTPNKADPEGKATQYNVNSTYIAGDWAISTTPCLAPNTDSFGIAECKVEIRHPDTTSPGPHSDPSVNGNLTWNVPVGAPAPGAPGHALADFDRIAEQLPVKDYVYPDPDFLELGTSVPNFSDLSTPPIDSNDPPNFIPDLDSETVVRDMIAALYPNEGNPDGSGRIEYCAESFGGAGAGYYRTVSQERPYRAKIRTPEKHSLIDQNRMPMALDPTNWRFAPVDWDPRTSGDNETNPGPSVFKDHDQNPRQVEINAMSFFRGRLFLSSLDTVFSSRLGNFDNFFTADPGSLTASDPIDIPTASNKYTPIQSMTPFSEFLFITTDGDTQYELTGSEDLITPFTAELKATSFYSTSPLVDPLLMGSQVYFFAPKRLYIYFASFVQNINSAVEVTKHCPNYLPRDVFSESVSPAQDSLFFVDRDKKNHLYCYVNRFSGDQVIQNAVFRFILDSSTSIVSTVTFDDELHLVVRMPDWNGKQRLYLVKADLTPEDYTIPRIDSRFLLDNTDGTNVSWDPDLDETTFNLPYADPDLDECIVYDGYPDSYWTSLDILRLEEGTLPTQTNVVVAGNWSDIGGKFFFGKNFNMSVQLSQQYSRDQDNNIIDGVLSLRTMILAHHNTGDYDVVVHRRGRDPMTSSFHRTQSQELGALEIEEPFEINGEFTAKVFGGAAEADIFIQSNYPTPCNIINMELKGRFKRTYSSAFN